MVSTGGFVTVSSGGTVMIVSGGTGWAVVKITDHGRGFDPASLQPDRAPARSVLPFRRRRVAAPAQWPYPRPSGPSVMRNRLSRSRHRAERRALARLPESGRGMAIMRACVDDVTLRSRPGRGTVVSLHKRIELRSDAPLARPEVVPLRNAG